MHKQLQQGWNGMFIQAPQCSFIWGSAVWFLSMRFPSVLHLLAQADIWHSKAILLFILLNNWNSSFHPPSPKPHKKSFFIQNLEANLIVKVVKVPTLWFKCMYAWRKEGLSVHVRACIILSEMHYLRFGSLPQWHVSCDGWVHFQWAIRWPSGECADVPASAAHLNASLLFVFPAVLPPSPPFPSLSFEPSFKLHVFRICHPCCLSLSLSAVVSLAPTVLCCIDMRIPALPREKCNLIMIKQLAGDAVCV